MITAEQQAKDARDIRYFCAHFDEVLNGMRQAYERQETKCDARAANQNAYVRVMETFVQAMAARLEAIEGRQDTLEGRVDTLEDGDRW